jgi:glycosyltransferase involved in cell wall biosynthesis
MRPWHFSGPFRSRAAELAAGVDFVFGQEVWTADVDVGRKKLVSVLHLPRLDRLSRVPDGPRHLEQELMIRRLLKKADLIRLVGQHMRHDLSNSLKERSVVIPFALDASFYPVADPMTTGDPLTFGSIINETWKPSLEAGRIYRQSVQPSIRVIEPTGRHLVGGFGVNTDRGAWSDDTEVWGTFNDVRSFLSAIDVLVVPGKIGSGVRVKVLEALASGIPVAGAGAAANGIGLDVSAEACFAVGWRSERTDEGVALSAVQVARERRKRGVDSDLRSYVEQYHDPSIVARELIRAAELTGIVG